MTLNFQAMNILSCALDASEYNRVSGCDSAHEMWKLLEVTHEGTNQVKDESEGEEKANLCFIAIENEVQSSPSNLSNFIDDDDDDLNSLLIEMYHELEKITKKNKELKNKIDNLSNENSKLVCENKTLLESLKALKKESDSLKLEFQKLILENKNLCEKVFSLEKCMVDYDDLMKKVSDLTLCIEKFTNGKENFEKLICSQRSPFNKSGIGYNHTNTSSKQTCFVKTSSPFSHLRCTYCEKSGHKATKCFIKRKIERGVKTIWKIKENITNIHGPKKIWVPKVFSTSFFVGTQLKVI
ncbi:hypothetical protein M9H77_18571 [Catharanthus roseus]|uniref:Uncharacterized protein n=1 Tax=Catharanthus roseus TaxID=4058 RepID=A0ACC0B7U5_CATRO|nr:hypothetical protein M9H77_18571 [Catharanthus roseus]